MGTEKLRRVCLFLREAYPKNHITKRQIEDAISIQIGTSQKALKENFDALKRLGYIKGRWMIHNYMVTNKA